MTWVNSCTMLFSFHFCLFNTHEWAHYTLQTSSVDTSSLCISTFSYRGVRGVRRSLPSILHLRPRLVKFMSCLDNAGCKSFSPRYRRWRQTVSMLTKHLTFRCSRMPSDLTPPPPPPELPPLILSWEPCILVRDCQSK